MLDPPGRISQGNLLEVPHGGCPRAIPKGNPQGDHSGGSPRKPPKRGPAGAHLGDPPPGSSWHPPCLPAVTRCSDSALVFGVRHRREHPFYTPCRPGDPRPPTWVISGAVFDARAESGFGVAGFRLKTFRFESVLRTKPMEIHYSPWGPGAA